MDDSESVLTVSESIAISGTGNILDDAKAIIDASQVAARTAVNVALVQRNWLLGKRIAEEELRGGSRRETYGREIVQMLSEELSSQYGKGFSATSLWYYVQFYRSFPNILHAASGESRQLLSWTHCRTPGNSYAATVSRSRSGALASASRSRRALAVRSTT